MTGWDWTWTGLLGGFLAGFAVFETLALRERARGKPGGTLTAYLKRWIGIEPRHWRRWILGPLFGGGLAVLGVHILGPWF
ncbi:hypothetical protein BAY59_10825 [Prauserella coralliicola]|nr:hypothetical protein BAY59_10825 [Prauserella coralliicola]